MANDDERVERKTTRTAPPAAPPPIVTQFERNGAGQWARLAVYAAVALIVVGAVVLGGRWLYNRSDNKAEKKPVSTTGKTTTRTPSSERKKSSAATDTSGQSDTQPSSGTTSGQSISGSDQDQRLANTGPGEVVTLFAGVTLAAAGLHYIYQLRRAS